MNNYDLSASNFNYTRDKILFCGFALNRITGADVTLSASIQILTLTVAQAAKLAQLHVKTWRETYQWLLPQDFLDKLSESKRAENWSKIMETLTGDQLLLGAWRGDELIAFLHAGPARTPVENSDFELFAIYVAKAAQGTGLGRELMNHFKRFGRKSGKKRAHLLVLKNNPAEPFYLHTGWRLSPMVFDLKLNGQSFQENSYVLDL